MTEQAPGWPGIPARWTSSAKSGVGTALNTASRVWFTISHGILDEIYYPRLDRACTRDLGFMVTDGHGFFSEEKRHANHAVEYLAEGAPAYRVTNTCKDGRYRIEKEIITHSEVDAVLQRIRFEVLKGRTGDYRLYVIVAPHLGNRGSGNTAWIGDHKGVEMLFAEREGYALAVACSAGWVRRSAGFVGTSDGWQDLFQHKTMTWSYERAENGNVAITGEIDLAVANGQFVLAVGFGSDHVEAGYRALNVVLQNFDSVRDQYIGEWQRFQETLYPCEGPRVSVRDLYRISTCVMHCHEAKAFLGAIIASLSIPWGYAKGDEDLGGYHLVWPRDLVETAIGLLSVGANGVADRVLKYLRATQDPDGKWPQNMWVPGTAYWSGIQMDETAFPLILLDHAEREGVLPPNEKVQDYWPMVKRASTYLLRNGPVTMEDRWETDPGYSPFTLAIEVAGLLAAADVADAVGERKAAVYMRETADTWNDNIERWTYVTATDLDRQVGVEGHYLRIGSPSGAEEPPQQASPLQKRAAGTGTTPEAYLIGTEPLALVRFGLRDPKDPRIVNTVKVMDAVLKKETPCGPAWRRYIGDEYGEHEDGSPFNGTGIGRAWPLLTGERAHYELAAGNRDEAVRLLQAMEAFANDGGLIPEQVWDAEDIPEKELFFGRPAGSAMPLVWAHAEYVKLRRSLDEDRVYDLPSQTVKRYLADKTVSPFVTWRFNNKCVSIPAGKVLRIELLAAARVRWSLDNWQSADEAETKDTTLSIHIVDLPTRELPPGANVVFTMFWKEAGCWEGENFETAVIEGHAG